jgi:MFS family permease
VLDYGWRLPFIAGGAFGLLAVFLRRMLAETPVFEELRARAALVEGLPLRRVLAGHGRAVVASMLLTWVLTAAIVVVILMTPSLMQGLFALPAERALRAGSIATLTLTFGCIAFGALADRLGAARTLALGCAAVFAANYTMYADLAGGGSNAYLYFGLAGFCVGMVAVVPVVMVRVFPAAIRFSGLSFSYNVAYAVFGGLTPLVVTLMMKDAPIAPAHYVGAVCLLGIATAIGLRWIPTDAPDVAASHVAPAN